ncbi:L,D-transpeptidase family protein [Rhodoplanes sp. Z2-YC6860]|uniref:L,D-transpeptidase family protein n=1 Tax=Rhodoplanes sp. Z2-YC6860 TaxID=674703 RepID=UPI00078B7A7A|nr:L,D-transpeptidase family protein [Rhodoplanes sp. Z2-YC6860]AMN39331.1 peptidoglycan binding domain-containing protein [Rhodoplanes sp. Z2-YC6860]
MRKFLLATTAAAVVLTMTGRVFAENEPPTATIAPPKAATPEGLLFNKDASEAKPIEAKPATEANPADAKPAEIKPTEAKPVETKPAEQAAAPAAPELGPVAQQIRDIVEGKFSQYIPREQDRVGVTAFYKARNYAPLWVADGKETPRAQQVADFLGKVTADGLNPEDYPVPQFGNTDPAKSAANELALTHSILNYARHASLGRVAFSRVSGAVYYDQKAQTPDAAAVLTKLSETDNVGKVLDSYEPQHHYYKALKAELAAARGGQFSEIDNNRGPVKATEPAKSAKAKGKKVEEAAHPANATVDTIIANMERFRWMPHELGNAYVMVNIPDYTLRLVQDDKVVWQTKIVAGKPGQHATPLLTETMKFITVNPTWNVPPSIIRNEYLPALAQDPNALNRIGLKVTHNADGSIRIYQPPGERNALGRIRFNFPNRFLVYQHDTPDKHLFDKSVRAFSHGCMRVQNPDMYAEKLLGVSQPEEGYTQARIKGMYGSNERNINFKHPIPVYITYQTVFTDDAGHKQVRADVYGLDKDIKNVLHGERGKADVPVARNYNSSSKPVASNGGNRRYSSAYESNDNGWGGSPWRQQQQNGWGGGGGFFGGSRFGGMW